MPKHEHLISWKTYLAVWAALMMLTAITVTASRLNLGPFNTPLALGIATLKAALVALFFMHLLYDEKFNLVVLGTGLLFVLIFLALTLSDPLTRGRLNPIQGREINPAIVRPEFAPSPTPTAPAKK
jgi:cytochrome c oxidase subunit 4